MATRGKKANGRYKEQLDDFVAAGFHRIDDQVLSANAPKIAWGDIYKRWPEADKVRHLEKLAATMNHAARLVSDERDKLVELCALKEEQLAKMAKQMQANNAMLQQEVTRMNAQRQGYHAEVARLNARIRELEKG